MDAPAGILDRSDQAAGSRSAAPRRAPALNGIVTNEVETLEPGHGVLAAVLTPKGKMLGDLRILDTGDELLLDMERAALQAVFDAVRHGLVGYDARAAQAHARRPGCSRCSGRAAASVAGAPGLPDEEHAHVAARDRGRARPR